MRYLVVVILFAVTLLALPFTAMAQTSSLQGQVTDESGAYVPSAKVTLTGPGGAKVTTANESGVYSFTGLAPGNYTIQSSTPELAMDKPMRVVMKAGAQTLDLRMRIASTAQQITVQESVGNTVTTDPAGNATALVLSGEELRALSDDPDDLAADLQALAGPSAGPNGGSIYIDGFSGGEIPPKESIREIRINQNPFSPEFDKLGYGRIEIFTKPGADKYHATVDYNFANDFWNSRNPFSAQKAPLLLNEFEGSGGGPINKRTSFTLDAQRNMVDNGAITNAITLDPNTLGITPFSSVVQIPQRFTRVSPRVDYQLSQNNTLIVRYSLTHVDINGAGIGTFDLASRGYNYQYTNQTVQATETAVIGTSINETRFQYFRSANQRIANSTDPAIQVLGAFNTGGSAVGQSFDTQNNFELQNYTTSIHGAHTWRYGIRVRAQMDDNVSPQNFNGSYIYGGGLAPILGSNNQPVLDASGQQQLANITSIERYRRTLLFQQLGYTPAQIAALGGGPTQFSVTTGIPALSLYQADVGIFAGDDWRIRPNVTLSLAVRYETQTNIHDWRDVAPRLAIAWAPGGGAKSAKPKTVIRGGFGTFYDRFLLGNSLTAQRYNGVVQQQYVISNPGFYSGIPSASTLASYQSPQITQEVDAHLRAPYIIQSAITVERQLPANVTLAVTYTNSHGLHFLRSQDLNAPLPGTYQPSVSNSGAFPLGQPSPVFLMTSSGVYNQNQMIANVNAKVNANLSLFGFYVLNKAMSNTDGLSTFAANPYNYSGEYGPASTDIRHRVTLGGSVNFRWNIRMSPFVILQSGAPFNLTTGSDLYGTTLFNGRPGIATNSALPGLIQTSYGLLDPNPQPGEQIVSRNYGRGPGLVTLNLRLGKTIGFGGEKSGGNRSGGGGTGTAGGMANAGAAGGGGLRSVIGAPSSNRRYNLTISLSARNLLNHTNYGPIVGDITSPLFGRSNQIAGSANGEGFSENGNNRRLELQLRFTF